MTKPPPSRPRRSRAATTSGDQDDYPNDQQDHTYGDCACAAHAEPEGGLAQALPQSLFRTVADDETTARFTRLRGPDPAVLLHGAEHVDRLVDGKDALGVA